MKRDFTCLHVCIHKILGIWRPKTCIKSINCSVWRGISPVRFMDFMKSVGSLTQDYLQHDGATFRTSAACTSCFSCLETVISQRFCACPDRPTSVLAGQSLCKSSTRGHFPDITREINNTDVDILLTT